MARMTAPQRRSEVKAFRLWCAAEALGWTCTLTEAARVAGIGIGAAKHIAAKKGWRGRFAGPAPRAPRRPAGTARDPWGREALAEILGG